MDEKSGEGSVAGQSIVDTPAWKSILEPDQARFYRNIYSNGKGAEIAKGNNLGTVCRAMEGVIRKDGMQSDRL